MGDEKVTLLTLDRELRRALAGEAVPLHQADQELIDVTMGKREGVPVSPDLIEQVQGAKFANAADLAMHQTRLLYHCPDDVKLAVACWLVQHMISHAKEGGTFRHLIYGRLGFGPEAYVPLYMAGGMHITNHFRIAVDQDARDTEDMLRGTGIVVNGE